MNASSVALLTHTQALKQVNLEAGTTVTPLWPNSVKAKKEALSKGRQRLSKSALIHLKTCKFSRRSITTTTTREVLTNRPLGYIPSLVCAPPSICGSGARRSPSRRVPRFSILASIHPSRSTGGANVLVVTRYSIQRSIIHSAFELAIACRHPVQHQEQQVHEREIGTSFDVIDQKTGFGVAKDLYCL